MEKKFSGQNLCSCTFGANIRSYTKQRARHGTPFLQPPPPSFGGRPCHPPPPPQSNFQVAKCRARVVPRRACAAGESERRRISLRQKQSHKAPRGRTVGNKRRGREPGGVVRGRGGGVVRGLFRRGEFSGRRGGLAALGNPKAPNCLPQTRPCRLMLRSEAERFAHQTATESGIRSQQRPKTLARDPRDGVPSASSLPCRRP